MRATAAPRAASTTHTYLICAAAWALPGGGHLWLGRIQKGLTFLVALPVMIVYVFLQRSFIRGMFAGAVKE